MVKVAAHYLGLLAVPTGAYAEDEASAAEQVEGGYCLGKDQRVALWDQCDAGAELDGAGRAGGLGERDVGIGEVGISPGDNTVVGAGEGAG